MKALPVFAPLAITLLACSGETAPTSPAAETAARPITAADVPQALAALTAEGILAGVEHLASDELEGRGTGTEGERKAAEWIAGQYEAIGLEPMGESFFQEVALVGYRKNAGTSTLAVKGPSGAIPYELETNLTYWSTAQKPVVDLKGAPLVFVGYGVEAPEVGWDDFKGYDATGKVLVFLNNDPPVTEDGEELFGGEARTYYGRWTYKFEQAMRHGAAGAVMIHTEPSAGYGWQVINASGEREGFALDLPGSGYQLDFLSWIHEDLADQLAQTVGSTLEGWFEAGKTREFQPVELPIALDAHLETEIRKTTSQNVVGLLRGNDPQVSDEVLVFSAHYDHLGTNDEGDDRVYNGAWDNAAGTAAIIQTARALAASEVKPRRSIAFLACAAEEKGSLGSLWFVQKPPVPLFRLVANLNVDMPQIFGVTRDMAAIGKVTNSLGDVLIEVAGEFGVEGGDGSKTPITITGDPRPNAGSFYRSDQVNFAKAGIPALFVNPGSDYVSELAFAPEEYRGAHYHQLSDEVSEEWDLTGLARDMHVLLLTALNVANAPEIPRWVSGNEFEGKWKELHPEL